jgi:hypothetical protein
MNSRLGMHGRDEEIRWLNAALGTAQRGAGVLVGIEGAAGTGKSRLVQEACERARARGALVLGTRALDYDRDVLGRLREAAEAADDTGGGAGTQALSITRVVADRKGRIVVRLSAPAAGRATVTATARIGRRTSRIARARKSARAAGPLRLTLEPRARARRALRRRLKVTVRVAFTPSGGQEQSVRRTVSLRVKR